VDRQRYTDEIGVQIIRLQPISIWNLVTNCSCGSPFICHLRGAGAAFGARPCKDCQPCPCRDSGFRIQTEFGICLPFGSRRVLTAACRLAKSS